MDSKLTFYRFFVTFGCPREPKGLPKSTKNDENWVPKGSHAQKGPQEVPREHFRLILDVFWMHFGAILEVFSTYFGGILGEVLLCYF